MSRIENRDSPDAEFRFFVYCPNDGDFTFYRVQSWALVDLHRDAA